jgi:hypothetical protein
MIAFAPKPITMLTGIRDYFPIDGARDTYAEVKRAFNVLDAGVHAGYFEYDDEHGWHKPRREATYRWLTKWLQGKEDDGTEPLIQPEPETNLNATPTGQLATSLGGETVHSINRRLAERMFPSRAAASIRDGNKMRSLISDMLRIAPRAGIPAVKSAATVRLETEPGIHVPILRMGLDGPGKRAAVLYVDSAGKAADLTSLTKLAESGKAVFAIDPRGWGESAPVARSGGYTPDWQLSQRAMLLGRPLIGMQVFDVLRTFDYVASLENIDASQISIIGKGHGGTVALYAGALEPRIASVTSDGAVASYMTIAKAPIHSGTIGIVVPGVLKSFDLPDVASTIAPRPLKIVSPRDAMGKSMETAAAEAEYIVTRKRYKDLKQATAFSLM